MTQTPPDTPSPAGSGGVMLGLPPGRQIMEYVIERSLGGGGFGITYLARDAHLGLPVALKEYLPSNLAARAPDGSVQALADGSQELFNWGLERFLDEARALATFRHPHIVRVLRYFPANGTAYIVMEYESGSPLRNWVRRQPPLGRDGLLKLVMPLLDGLEVIHKAQFLHRDIKPDNIYLRDDGSPVLIDFGSARRTSLGNDLTNIVSPGFAPFEQYHTRGKQGPWTDLYSLAAVMYWLVSGKKPIDAASRVKEDPLPPAIQFDPHHLYGQPLLRAIDWALHPDETHRPQSVADFRARLQLAVAEGGVASPTTDLTTQIIAPADRATGLPAGGAAAPSVPASSPLDSQRGTLVASVLFLDLVGYSKESVNEQYELKSGFNQFIAGKLAHIPDHTRITLDTGDGAAICFMGDPEEVLHTAADICRSLAAQARLQVRMGLHIGPVRILNDLNGRGNVIGDGINAAQRVMSFADANTLLVSRAFYDMVACLSDRLHRAFRYVGAQEDKHGRSHELYVLLDEAEGSLGDQTLPLAAKSLTLQRPSAPALDADMVAFMEQELTRHLGPLAPILMRKLKGKATSAEALMQQLAASLSDAARREAFVSVCNHRLQHPPSQRLSSGLSQVVDSSLRSSQSLTNTGLLRQDNASRPQGNFSGLSGFSPSNLSAGPVSIRPWLTQDQANQLEKRLAQILGPMARLVMKAEVRKAESYRGLCEALAAHLDDPKKRPGFLEDALALGQ